MDRDEDLGRDAGDEGDRVAAGGPRRVERVGEHVDRAGLGVVGVAGVEERRLAVGAQHDPDVGDARHRVVVEGVQLTDGGDRHVADRERLPLPRRHGRQPLGAQLLRRERVGVHGSAGVGPDEPRRALGVEVVGVVVRHDDRVETGQLLEPGREVAGVDEDAAIGRLDEQAGMSEVSHAHDPT